MKDGLYCGFVLVAQYFIAAGIFRDSYFHLACGAVYALLAIALRP